MRNAKGVFFGYFLVVDALLKFESVFLFKEVVVLCSRLMQLLHLALNALLHLRLLLVQLSLQQLRTVLHQLVSVQQVGLACVRHLDYAQTTLNLPSVISTHPELLEDHLARPVIFVRVGAGSVT